MNFLFKQQYCNEEWQKEKSTQNSIRYSYKYNNHVYWYYNQRLKKKTSKHFCFIKLIEKYKLFLDICIWRNKKLFNILYIQNYTVCHPIQFYYFSILYYTFDTRCRLLLFFFHAVHRCYLLIIFQHTYVRAYCSKSTYTLYTAQSSLICYCTTI